MNHSHLLCAFGSIALAAFLSSTTPSHAAICPRGNTCYYVNATTGNDANAGTSASSPWKTVARVNAQHFNPGEVVYFARGQKWREQLQISSSGTAALPITFRSYGSGAQPIISGSDVITSWAPYTPNIYYSAQSSWANAPGVTIQDGTPLRLVPWSGSIAATQRSLTAGSFTVDYTNKIVYIWSTDSQPPSTHTIEVAHRLYGVENNKKNFVTINGLTFEHAAFHCAYASSTTSFHIVGSTLRICGGTYIGGGLIAGNGIEWSGNGSNNSLQDSTVTGVLDSCASPQLYGSNETLRDTTISGNTLSYCGMNGVEISIQGPSAGVSNLDSFISGVTITRNKIYETGGGWSSNREGSGIVAYNNDGSVTSAITGVRISENIIHSNAKDGVELRRYSGMSIVDHNRISDNAKDGVEVTDDLNPTSTGIHLFDNLIYDNAKHGLERNVPASQAFHIYNNVLTNNGSDAPPPRQDQRNSSTPNN